MAACGSSGTVYIAGFETTQCPPRWSCLRRIALLAYTPAGSAIWTNYPDPNPYTTSTAVEARSLAVDPAGYICVLWDCVSIGGGGFVTRFDPAGNRLWQSVTTGAGIALDMAQDPAGNTFVTGSTVQNYPNFVCTTVKVNTNGQQVWRAAYQGPVQAQHEGAGVALDAAGNVYVVATSPGNGTGKDLATLKYDPDGNQLWVQRYNGPANGDDIATGLVVDSAGNVYVTGYSAATNGGTEFVTIKYAPGPTIRREASGAMLLQAPGAPGLTSGLQASTNLQSWLDLGLVPADTNGIFTFEDTNAPLFQQRYYRWYQP